METFIDNKFMSVFQKNGILVLRWKPATKDLTNDAFKSEAIKFINIVKQNQSKNIIVDMRNFSYDLTPEVIAWRNQNIIAVYNEIGVEKFAFISEKPTVKQDNPNNTFFTRHFVNEQEAENWLTS